MINQIRYGSAIYFAVLLVLAAFGMTIFAHAGDLPQADVLLSASDSIDYEPSATDQILVVLSELLASHDG